MYITILSILNNFQAYVCKVIGVLMSFVAYRTSHFWKYRDVFFLNVVSPNMALTKFKKKIPSYLFQAYIDY